MRPERTQPPQPCVMVIDDQTRNLRLLERLLQGRGFKVLPFTSGPTALRALKRVLPQVIVLDIKMPGMDGWATQERLAADPRTAEIPVIFLSGIADVESKARAFAVGGVDYITKPFQVEEVIARLETHLRIHQLQGQLTVHNRALEEKVAEQVATISDAQQATIIALARLAESRDDDTGQHILRVQRYCRILGDQLREAGVSPEIIDTGFVEDLSQASALHDIGKVAIPDAILLKPGPLTPSERVRMEQHTLLGAQTLQRVLDDYPNNRLLVLGEAIARYHHERWDGSGYPGGFEGEQIPISARIMAVGDVYDALRMRRPYKEPMPHQAAFEIIVEDRGSQFDPVVVDAFVTRQRDFERAFDRTDDQA